MLLAILLNSIIIFLLYFPQIEHGEKSLYKILENIDHLFIFLFVVEAAVKLKVLGVKEYFKSNWNTFDFIIVAISLPGLMTFVPFFAMHNFSFVKVLRLFRMIRLLRVISFVPRMESILAGLGRAIKASVFVIGVLVFLNLLISLFTCHLYGDLLPDHFGDPLISSYYIFQMFTVEGWNEIPLLIAEATKVEGFENAAFIAGASRFYFILVVLIGGIFGMSLANAIFVDEMTSDNNKMLEDKIDLLIAKINQLEDNLGK
ncbi:MAG: voltage-gated sodium channel [Saprospiraceae bacterium]|jgi:voltage-gated sodium channel